MVGEVHAASSRLVVKGGGNIILFRSKGSDLGTSRLGRRGIYSLWMPA